MSYTIVTRYHDFCYGHRVYGHENKCAHLHGHNGRVRFTVKRQDFHSLDSVGRVLDFSQINKRLCQWLEDNWDHRMLLWEEDPSAKLVKEIDEAVVLVPFNPTAENLAKHLVDVIGPERLRGTCCTLIQATFEETRKCSATYGISD